MKKRVISVILALCLLLSVVPMTVAAEGAPSLTPCKDYSHVNVAVGTNFTMTVDRYDGNCYRSILNRVYAVNLTGKETQAQLNDMAVKLLKAEAEYVHGSETMYQEPLSFVMDSKFTTDDLKEGTYLAVLVIADYTGTMLSGYTHTPLYNTVTAAGLHIAEAADENGHVHTWDKGTVTNENPGAMRAELVYTCTGCGETKTEYIHLCPATNFKDCPAETNWAHDGIDYCVAHGLMNGVSADRFDLTGLTTRAQFVTILWRYAGSPEPSEKMPFVDVPKGAYYEKAAAWAYQNGVVNGTDKTHFSPNVPLSREMCAAILFRYTEEVCGFDLQRYVDLADLSKFPDVKNISDYAKDAMAWANFTGIIKGVSSSTGTYLQPQATASRDQIATIFMRYCQFRDR